MPDEMAPMTARYMVADVFDGLATLPDESVDLVVTSPPFLALRSYLPADHPDKGKEIGSEATPAEFIDVMLRVTQELRRVLAPHGSICVELGDTYSGSGGGGGDYLPGGWREGQQQFAGSADSMRESNAAHWRQKNEWKKGGLANYNDARGNPDGMRDPTFSGANTLTGSGAGWPLAKSKALIAELYQIALAYGINPLTGTESPAGRWRIRNVVTWVRPNPPVGALGDKWRPATSDLVVACTSGKRYWDDLATRKPSVAPDQVQRPRHDRSTNGREGFWDEGNGRFGIHPAGAPLLDWWEIPPGGYSGKVATKWHRPVDRRESVGDIQRTTSADCPEHGGQPDQAPTEPHDGPPTADQTHHSPDTDGRPVQGQLDGSLPSDGTTDHSDSSPSPKTEQQDRGRAPAAKPHSKASNKTDRAPATSPADTPSEEKTDRTDGTPTSPSSDVHRLDTDESRTSEDGSDGNPGSQTSDRTVDIDTLSGTCTCSYYVIETQYTSHYAVFPEELVIPCVQAMCPPKVCRTCGEPSRRITETTPEYDAKRSGKDIYAETGPRDRATGMHGGTRPPTLIASERVTTGWTSCGHDDWRPGLILDPFAGSGTTLAVATGYGHDAIGIDLDPRNAELALDRVGPFLLEVGP